ncbi:hypothetical protein OSTOST_10139 [Ostertagia ostertagi]
MAEAQGILRDIERRNIPVKLEEVECGPSCADVLNSVFISNGDTTELEDVKAREMHRGLDGRSHPMSRVLLYDNKRRDSFHAYYVDKEWLRLKTPQEAAIWSICLYVSRSMSEDERIRVSDAFNQVVTSSGLRLSGAQRV